MTTQVDLPLKMAPISPLSEERSDIEIQGKGALGQAVKEGQSRFQNHHQDPRYILRGRDQGLGAGHHHPCACC